MTNEKLRRERAYKAIIMAANLTIPSDTVPQEPAMLNEVAADVLDLLEEKEELFDIAQYESELKIDAHGRQIYVCDKCQKEKHI